METLLLPAARQDSMEQALAVLDSGGLVAFPTDTVYGLGVPAFNGPAIEAIYTAKERPPEKAIPILIADAEEIGKISRNVPVMALILAEQFWPGPLTLVVPKVAELPEAISATDTVAVRVPDHPVARQLLRLAGPMAVTSANRSGESSPVSAEDVYQQLQGRIALILDGGATPGGFPSTVVDCTGSEPLVLRKGPVSEGIMQKALRNGWGA